MPAMGTVAAVAPAESVDPGPRWPEVALSGVALTALLVLPLAELVARRVLGVAIPGAATWTQHLTLWLTFLGGVLAARFDRHLALSAASFLPPGRLRDGATTLRAAATVLVALLLASASASFVRAQRSSTELLAGGIPVWCAQAVMPLGFLALALRAWWRAPGGRVARPLVLGLVGASAGAWAAGLRGPALLAPGVAAIAACVLSGAPLFVAIGGFALLLLHAAGVPIAAVAAETYRLAASPSLPTIPLFALAGTVLAAGGASRRLVGLFRGVAGWLPGGTAVAAVGACAFLTAVTGASGVTILAVGGMLLPILQRQGFPRDSAVGLLTASGSVGLLFPPSLPVILYAVYAEVSFQEVFTAGFVPGVILVVAFTGWAIRAGRRSGVERTPFRAGEAVHAALVAKWDLLLPVVVVLAISTGFATLVEAAALAAAWVLFVELVVHRTLTLRRDGLRVVAETAVVFGSLLFVLGVALGLTSYLVDAEAPMRAAEWARRSISSRWLFLLLLNVFLLAVGMLMDIFSAIVVMVPLLLPMGRTFGIHPLHLGVVFLANLELGYLTPPVGLNLFLGSLRFRRPMLEVARSTLPLAAVMVVWVLLITYVPPLTLGLGALLGR